AGFSPALPPGGEAQPGPPPPRGARGGLAEERDPAAAPGVRRHERRPDERLRLVSDHRRRSPRPRRAPPDPLVRRGGPDRLAPPDPGAARPLRSLEGPARNASAARRLAARVPAAGRRGPRLRG